MDAIAHITFNYNKKLYFLKTINKTINFYNYECITSVHTNFMASRFLVYAKSGIHKNSL